jgi:hypothetical protein
MTLSAGIASGTSVEPSLQSTAHSRPAAQSSIPTSSEKWGGYAMSGTTAVPLTNATATAYIPWLSCAANETSQVEVWVGLGGTTGSVSLPQVGFVAECRKGTAQYLAWAEWYDPNRRNREIFQHDIALVPGDEVNMSIHKVNATHYDANMIEFPLGDTNGNDQISMPVVRLTDPGGLPVGNTSECVVERPEIGGGGYEPLSYFSSVTFGQCQANYTLGPTSGIDWIDGITGVQFHSPPNTVYKKIATGLRLHVTRINLTSTTNKSFVQARTGPVEASTDYLSDGFTVTQYPHLPAYNAAPDQSQPGETACGLENVGYSAEMSVYVDRVSCAKGVQLLATLPAATTTPDWYCSGVQDGLIFCTSGISPHEPLHDWTASTVHVRAVPEGGALPPTS